MRELKFRAFVEVNGKPLFTYSSDIGLLAFFRKFEYDKNIEQYTGLKDKNGKEIYEGDILEEEIDAGIYGIDGTFMYRVYWNEAQLCWSLEPIGSKSIHNDLWEVNRSVMVIGNIHDNPGLLKGEE